MILAAVIGAVAGSDALGFVLGPFGRVLPLGGVIGPLCGAVITVWAIEAMSSRKDLNWITNVGLVIFWMAAQLWVVLLISWGIPHYLSCHGLPQFKF